MTAVVWGLIAGAFFLGGWFLSSHIGDQGEPILLPGQSRSTVFFSEVVTGVEIFFGTGIPVALLIYFRPSKREDSHDA
jgi:hypothetical protein